MRLKRFNLDTSAVITFVSNMTYGVIRRTKSWEMAVKNDTYRPLLGYLTGKGFYPFSEKEFVICEAVRKEVVDILSYGDLLEQQRYYQLNINVIPDVDDLTIKLSRRVQATDRIFIATGESLGLQSITADRKLVSVLHSTNLKPNVIVIPPRSLTC